MSSCWIEWCVLRSQSNPPECLVVWSADRSHPGLSAPLVRWIHPSCMFSDPFFLINWINSLLLIKIRESISFHRPFKKKVLLTRDVLRDYSFIYRDSSLCHCCCTISLNGDNHSSSAALFIMSSCLVHQPWPRQPTSGWNVPDASHTYRHMDARTAKYIFLLLKWIFPCVEVVCRNSFRITLKYNIWSVLVREVRARPSYR
jgi:hypothetical protein